MIAFRKTHPSIARSQFWRDDVSWYGRMDSAVDLSPVGPDPRLVPPRRKRLHDDDIYVMVNSSPQNMWFRVQEGSACRVERPLIADTARPGAQRLLESADYAVDSRSVVVLCRARI